MIRLLPLQGSDREQFVRDNQEAFRYGAMEEFGLRDSHFEELCARTLPHEGVPRLRKGHRRRRRGGGEGELRDHARFPKRRRRSTQGDNRCREQDAGNLPPREEGHQASR